MRIYDPSSYFFFFFCLVCLLGTNYVSPPRVRGWHTDSPQNDLWKWDVEDEVNILSTQKVEFLTVYAFIKRVRVRHMMLACNFITVKA